MRNVSGTHNQHQRPQQDHVLGQSRRRQPPGPPHPARTRPARPGPPGRLPRRRPAAAPRRRNPRVHPHHPAAADRSPGRSCSGPASVTRRVASTSSADTTRRQRPRPPMRSAPYRRHQPPGSRSRSPVLRADARGQNAPRWGYRPAPHAVTAYRTPDRRPMPPRPRSCSPCRYLSGVPRRSDERPRTSHSHCLPVDRRRRGMGMSARQRRSRRLRCFRSTPRPPPRSSSRCGSRGCAAARRRGRCRAPSSASTCASPTPTSSRSPKPAPPLPVLRPSPAAAFAAGPSPVTVYRGSLRVRVALVGGVERRCRGWPRHRWAPAPQHCRR